MDPIQFDALSRKLADGVSRRQAVARFGAAGLLAGLTSALGRERVARAAPAAQADFCLLEIVATIRLGPSAGVIFDGSVPGELRGDLSFPLTADGAIETNGQLRLPGGAPFPVVGQVTGRALNLRVDLAPEQSLILVGTAAQPLTQCTGDVDGLLTGPGVGDLGDWHATGTLVPGGEGPPPTATAGTAPGAPTAASPPAGTPTATAPAGATATSTATATATATATPTETPAPAPTETPTPAPTETPTPQPPTPTPVVCPTGTTDCGGVCLDLQTDVNNCGACGNVCPEAQPGFDVGCAAGNCFFMREPACAEGLTSCNGVCVNRQTDPANCGLCGNVCAAGQVCFAGQCATDHRCDPGLTFCNGVCVDLLIDPANCGACGSTCGIIETCLGGQCQPPAASQ